jgi:hypothetical protein
MDNRKPAPAILTAVKFKAPKGSRKLITGSAPAPGQKQDIVLTAEERALVSMYRRMSGGDAELVYGLSAKWAMDEDAKRKQSVTQPRFRVIAGGRSS